MSTLKKTVLVLTLASAAIWPLLPSAAAETPAADAPANIECKDGVCRLKPTVPGDIDRGEKAPEPAAAASEKSGSQGLTWARDVRLSGSPNFLDLATAINKAGYYKGIRLAGKVKVVEYGADIKVQVVSSFPDLKVKVVDSFPDKIGEWKFVEYGQDFSVQFVDSFPDIRIKYVTSFPGVES